MCRPTALPLTLAAVAAGPLRESESDSNDSSRNFHPRWAVARNPSTPADVLVTLARSPFYETRSAVLGNPNTPRAVKQWLRAAGLGDPQAPGFPAEPVLEMARETVLVGGARRRAVGIGAADEAGLERVHAEPFGFFQAFEQRAPRATQGGHLFGVLRVAGAFELRGSQV